MINALQNVPLARNMQALKSANLQSQSASGSTPRFGAEEEKQPKGFIVYKPEEEKKSALRRAGRLLFISLPVGLWKTGVLGFKGVTLTGKGLWKFAQFTKEKPKIGIPIALAAALGVAPVVNANFAHGNVAEVRERWFFDIFPGLFPSAYLSPNGNIVSPWTRLPTGGSIDENGVCWNLMQTRVGSGTSDGNVNLIAKPGEPPYPNPVGMVTTDGRIKPMNYTTFTMDWLGVSLGQVNGRSGQELGRDISRQQAAALVACVNGEDLNPPNLTPRPAANNRR